MHKDILAFKLLLIRYPKVIPIPTGVTISDIISSSSPAIVCPDDVFVATGDDFSESTLCHSVKREKPAPTSIPHNHFSLISNQNSNIKNPVIYFFSIWTAAYETSNLSRINPSIGTNVVLACRIESPVITLTEGASPQQETPVRVLWQTILSPKETAIVGRTTGPSLLFCAHKVLLINNTKTRK